MSSEISSVESDFSDLRTIAAGLGIMEQEEIYTERFKIDRGKLEDMLKGRELLMPLKCVKLIHFFNIQRTHIVRG